MHMRWRLLLLALASLSAAACRDRTAEPCPRLAAVLTGPRSWGVAYRQAWTRLAFDEAGPGPQLSEDKVGLGTVRWGDGEESVACTEYRRRFVVHMSFEWIERHAGTGGPPPEIHCRVLDSGNRPLRSVGVFVERARVWGQPPPAWPLSFMFSREDRDLSKARVVVTTEEREHEFRYASAAAAPAGEGEQRPADDAER